jgi:hypothetical protein
MVCRVLTLSLLALYLVAAETQMGAALKAATADQRNRIGWNSTMPMQVVPLVIRGDGWKQQIIIQNTDRDKDSNLTLAFGRMDGTDWRIGLRLRGLNAQSGNRDEVVTDSVFTVWMTKDKGQAILEISESWGPQELGMAIVIHSNLAACDSSSSPVRCPGEFFGQSVFRKRTQGDPDLMTTMPFSAPTNRTISVFYDNEEWKYPGVGVVAFDARDLTSVKLIPINLRIVTADGSIDKVVQRYVPNGGLIWFSLVNDFPETIGKLGRINVSCNIQSVLMSSMSLQFAPNRAFTAISTFEAQGVAP